MKRIKLIFLLLLINNTSLFATNYYVSNLLGNDKNQGLSEEQPFKTLQKAANIAHAGDTVFIMNGIYTNSDNESGFFQSQIMFVMHSGKPDAWITFQALDGHKPKLRIQQAFGIRIVSTDKYCEDNALGYIRIKDLIIEGNKDDITFCEALNQPKSCKNPLGEVDWNFNGSGISIGSEGKFANPENTTHHIEILNCEVYNCSSAGISSYRSDYIKIDNCVVYNNGWKTVHGSSGIHIYNPRNCIVIEENNYHFSITNNEIFNNRNEVPFFDGKKCHGYTDGNGIIIDDAYNNQNIKIPFKGNFLIEGNEIYENGGSGITLYQSDNIVVKNNRTYKNCQLSIDDKKRAELMLMKTKNIVIENNIFYANNFQRGFYKGSKVKNITSHSNIIYNSKKDSKLKHSKIINPNFKNLIDSQKTEIKCDFTTLNIILNSIRKNLK